MTALKAHYGPAPAPATVINAVMFNLTWFAIVLTQSSVLAPMILIAHLLAHFYWVGRGRKELLLVGLVTVFGAAVDQLLFSAGVFNVGGQLALAPLWLTCLWPVFATTLLHAFKGLQHRMVLAALVGAAGGALSYSAGVRLTAVEFGAPLWGPFILAAVWAVVFPLLLQVATRLHGEPDALQSWHPQA
jgi:hypothetical protein